MKSITFAQRALIFTSWLALVGQGDAFWRMECPSRSGLARIDPLISPGSASAHAHAIHGSDGFSSTSSTDELLAGKCTSCAVSQDKSAYWTPAVYFKSASGKYSLVEQVGGMLAYYLLYPNAGQTGVTAFPEGFEMISGDNSLRNFSSYAVPDLDKSSWANTAPYNSQAFLSQAALGFNCLNYAKAPEGSLYRHFLPDKAYLDANCADGVRFELMFPSCWDGINKSSPDKKSHVAFPSEVMTGDCPKGFPKRLPSLFYETIWNTYAFKGQDGEFVISNGDTTGYGYHGDFIMGWDGDFLQQAANTCTNPSGRIEDCPLFTIQDDSISASCNISSSNIPAAAAKDALVSGLSSLPGNVKIAAGPAPAGGAAPAAPKQPSSAAPNSKTKAVVPTVTYRPGSSAPSGSYAPGAIFATKPAPVAPSSIRSAQGVVALTSAPIAPSASATPSFFSTQYETKGNTVEEIFWVEQDITTTIYAGPTVVPRANRERKRHLHRHQHGRLAH